MYSKGIGVGGIGGLDGPRGVGVGGAEGGGADGGGGKGGVSGVPGGVGRRGQETKFQDGMQASPSSSSAVNAPPFPPNPRIPYTAAVRIAEDEAVASGFSPRAFNMVPSSSQVSSRDPYHMQSTTHKRTFMGQAPERLSSSYKSGGADVAISIPQVGAWPDSGLGLVSAHKRPANSMFLDRGLPSPMAHSQTSVPLSEETAVAMAKARAKVKMKEKGEDKEPDLRVAGIHISSHTPRFVQSLAKFPGGAVAAIQSSLGFGASWDRRKGMKRIGSIARSPTITKNIGSVTTLSDLAHGVPHWDSRVDFQTCLGAIFAFVLVLWLFKGLPILSLLYFWLPTRDSEDPPGTSWIEFFAIVILIFGVAALLRSAFPRTFKALRIPSFSKLAHAFPSKTWSAAFMSTWGKSPVYLTSQKGNPKGYLGDKKSSFGGSWEYLGSLREPQGRGPPAPAGRSPSKVSGCAVHSYSNGDRYEGEFYQGKCSGSGVYIFAASGRYEGDWVDGKYDGYGVETWSRGSRYRGQYRQGLREGYGVYRFYTGDVYAGMWSKGQSHGVGVQTCSDGSRYVGEFTWGAKHGFGKYTFRNGDVYSGEYFRDKMHGYGTYQFANGHCYEGAWHEGRKQGLGIYTFRNGESRAGYWHMGALETRSTASSTAASSPNAVNHSRVLHAIQEARRATAKAEHVMRVDDRVSKAVSAANRAAVAARVAAVKAGQRGSTSNLGHSP